MAFFIMVLAWLLQGMMPALALPMSGTGHHGMAETKVHQHKPSETHAGHSMSIETAAQTPCPSCGDKPVKSACTMSLCGACTTVLPLQVLEQVPAPAFRYPAPALVPALVALHAAPLLPPPRA
ncbi:hypothetical protein [Rhizobium sp. FY34]|uniref:hypothetical protein n=1 Tax=Rhizobium sp. FY34 TaxID=2562309 RepID=UPI0010C0C35E|nr:hypothetical protein [Rhizobium sp. FY34]